jgi:hypothetical protein
MSKIGAAGRKVRDRETLTEAAAVSGPANDRKGANGVPPGHSFSLDFVDNRGYRWEGTFKFHVLNTREKINVGLVKSRLSGGVAAHLLDSITSHMLEMLAWLAVALDEAPDWASGDALETLYDPGVIEAIYKEVAEHEARFHGTAAVPSSESGGTGS